MSDETPRDPNLPPPDIRGRRLDHPASDPLKAELLGLTTERPLEVLIPHNDVEAANFADMIQEFLRMNGRDCVIQAVRFDPPVRGLHLHEGEDKVQMAVGHR